MPWMEQQRAGDDLFLADVQHLHLPSRIFNTVIGTFVFCSVPDPVQGLCEIGGVVRTDEHIVLWEHVRIDRPSIGRLMDTLAPLIVRLNGANINRRTLINLQIAGLKIDHVVDLDKIGMFKLISARPGARSEWHGSPSLFPCQLHFECQEALEHPDLGQA
jgi:phosphatidylethanolamine/phosphatidyl-N-methylethanolamine N-methyltransferase